MVVYTRKRYSLSSSHLAFDCVFSFPLKVKVSQSCPTLCDPMDYTVHGQNIGVGSLSLLQGIFPTQGLNPGLPHCRWIQYQLNYKKSLRILEWLAYPFSSESSQPRNWSGVPWVGKIPWRRKWQPTPVFLPGKFHGQWSLVGYSPRGRKESDTTERLLFTLLLIASGVFTNSAMREALETPASLDKQAPTLARIPAHLTLWVFLHSLIIPLLVDYGVLPLYLSSHAFLLHLYSSYR